MEEAQFQRVFYWRCQPWKKLQISQFVTLMEKDGRLLCSSSGKNGNHLLGAHQRFVRSHFTIMQKGWSLNWGHIILLPLELCSLPNIWAMLQRVSTTRCCFWLKNIKSIPPTSKPYVNAMQNDSSKGGKNVEDTNIILKINLWKFKVAHWHSIVHFCLQTTCLFLAGIKLLFY